MNSRLPSWLPLAGVLAAAGMLFWLLVVYAGDQRGLAPLAESAVGTIVDRDGHMTIEQVAALPAGEWQPAAAGRLSFARDGATLWLRITLRNPGARPLAGVLANHYFFSDHVDAWFEEGGAWQRLRSGEAVPMAERALAGRSHAFPISVPARSEQVVYLRAGDYFNAFVRFGWWARATDFFDAREREMLAEGLYFGGLLALLGYNLLLWLRLRLPDIGYYVLYLGSNVIFFGLARALIPALGATLRSPALETILVTVLALGGFCLVQFARTFLELPARTPKHDRLARGLGYALLVCAGCGLAMAWAQAIMFAVVAAVAITHVVLFSFAVSASRAGVRPARYFLASFGCFFGASVVVVIAWWLHLDATDLTLRSAMIGSALEMLLLSLATADRFVQAQRRLIEETEQRRAIEEAYADELAEEVRERTHELEQANVDKDRMLAVIGHDLRSPLTGLMRAADEAPGDFARDAARTGRTLLLMIEDLVLWARLRAGTCVLATHSAHAVMAPAVALHRSLAERGGTELILEVADDLRVETDLVLAQTLARNLVANALKFARTRVVLRAAALPAGGVRFTVGNDGPALSAEVAARIAADEDGPMTATGGLGLRLCREICRALGVKLEAHAALRGGTEFGFTLKAVPTTAAVPA